MVVFVKDVERRSRARLCGPIAVQLDRGPGKHVEAGILWTWPSTVTCPFSMASRTCRQESSWCFAFSCLSSLTLKGSGTVTRQIICFEDEKLNENHVTVPDPVTISAAERNEDCGVAAGDQQHRRLARRRIERVADVVRIVHLLPLTC